MPEGRRPASAGPQGPRDIGGSSSVGARLHRPALRKIGHRRVVVEWLVDEVLCRGRFVRIRSRARDGYGPRGINALSAWRARMVVVARVRPEPEPSKPMRAEGAVIGNWAPGARPAARNSNAATGFVDLQKIPHHPLPQYIGS